MDHLHQYLDQIQKASAGEIVAWALETFGDRLAQATSLGAEDQVITALLAERRPSVRIFTLDTGRLFPDTYDVMQATRDTYGVGIEIFFPQTAAVEDLVKREGPNLFYKSPDNRRACCAVRKGEPLRRALAGVSAWMTGLRRAQGMTRTDVQPVSWDGDHGLYKIAPLWNWSDAQVWEYVESHGVPVNRLHARGFASIGCAPCTRAVGPGEDPRSGRWWWERAEHRECGLHRP